MSAADSDPCPSLTLPVSRARAHSSSTNIRPPLTVCLNRIKSTPPPQQQQQLEPPPIQPSMLLILVSRLLHLFHPKHDPPPSSLSSPSSTTDDLPLPMSATRSTFGADRLPEKESSTPFSLRAPILLVLLLFPLSTALILFCLGTLPISFSWPNDITDLARLGRELHGYSQSGPVPMAHVVAVMSITAVWKHAWSIPGSVVWNVLAGALFPPALATLLLTTLTTIGSLCATLLSAPLSPFLTHFFPKALAVTRSAINPEASSTKRTSHAWVRLSILRLIGVVPWSGINIACGVCGVRLTDCLLGAFIGTLPWTAVTCQIGDILQAVASTPSPTPKTVTSLLISPEILLKLVFLTFLSLAPILGREWLRSMMIVSDGEEEGWRWIRVKEWRNKMRIGNRVATQREDMLQVLVNEKQADGLP